MSKEEKNYKELEAQIFDWTNRIKIEPKQVDIEIKIAQFMLIWNINDNISLIRDMLASKLK